jgi:hypothetical protein
MRRKRRKTRGYSREYVDTASGVAWYDREQWQHLRQVAADPEVLEESYDEWVAMAENAIRELEARGMIIERVPVNTTDLVAWCREQDRPVDGSARAEFAAREFRKLHLSE